MHLSLFDLIHNGEGWLPSDCRDPNGALLILATSPDALTARKLAGNGADQ